MKSKYLSNYLEIIAMKCKKNFIKENFKIKFNYFMS